MTIIYRVSTMRYPHQTDYVDSLEYEIDPDREAVAFRSFEEDTCTYMRRQFPDATIVVQRILKATNHVSDSWIWCPAISRLVRIF